MKVGDSILLKVPGAESRYGYLEKEFTFDDMVRIQVQYEHVEPGDRKPEKLKQPYGYYAHRRDCKVQEIPKLILLIAEVSK